VCSKESSDLCNRLIVQRWEHISIVMLLCFIPKSGSFESRNVEIKRILVKMQVKPCQVKEEFKQKFCFLFFFQC